MPNTYHPPAWIGHAAHFTPRADCHLCAASARDSRPPCYCGQCGPIPPGVKPTPCNGQRMAWQRNERGVRDPQGTMEAHEESERDYVRSLLAIGQR